MRKPPTKRKMGSPRSGSKLDRPSHHPACDPRRRKDPSLARQYDRIHLRGPRHQKRKRIPHLAQPAQSLPNQRYRMRVRCQSDHRVGLLHHRDDHQLFVMLEPSRPTALMPRLGRAIITLQAPESRKHPWRNLLPAAKTAHRRLFAVPPVVHRSMSRTTMVARLQQIPHMELLPHRLLHRKCLYLFQG